MGKKSKVHFLTAYIEFLFEEGVKSEYYYLGDASRFLRFLLTRVDEEDISAFIHNSATSETYEKRLRKTLRKFCTFLQKELNIHNEALKQV